MLERFDVAPGGSSTNMTPSKDGEWVRFDDVGCQIPDEALRALIERECGPVQRIGDMLWAIEIARVVERAHGITP